MPSLKNSNNSLWFLVFLRKLLTLLCFALLFFFLLCFFSIRKHLSNKTLYFQIMQKSNCYINKILYLHKIFKVSWDSSLVLPPAVTPVHDNFRPLLKRFGVYVICRKLSPTKVKPSNFHIYLLNVPWPEGSQVNVVTVPSTIGWLGKGGTITAEIKVIDIWDIKITQKIKNIFTNWKL